VPARRRGLTRVSESSAQTSVESKTPPEKDICTEHRLLSNSSLVFHKIIVGLHTGSPSTNCEYADRQRDLASEAPQTLSAFRRACKGPAPSIECRVKVICRQSLMEITETSEPSMVTVKLDVRSRPFDGHNVLISHNFPQRRLDEGHVGYARRRGWLCLSRLKCMGIYSQYGTHDGKDLEPWTCHLKTLLG